ncbi:GtrA family protein [Paenibacillus polymyxa]|uniref:GtrA family protein n=1 Tax=Paenibacillus polymyxa TaxID=1406 RepID=UPI00215C05E9|nr:GtrA family protein [Paenibacillus polymyxa]MEE4578207.1 GtrA family protein [Paenibacillus polymyxa]
MTNLTLFQNSFFRFLVVGVLNTICGMSVMFLLFNILETNYWLSTFIGNSVGATVSYFLNKRFTFKNDANHGQTIWKFISIILICYILSYCLSYLISHYLISSLNIKNNEILGNVSILIGNVFYTLINYVGQKFIVFSKKTSAQKV